LTLFTTFGVRMLAVRFDWHLPSLQIKPKHWFLFDWRYFMITTEVLFNTEKTSPPPRNWRF
jgi:hypothetical protein